MKPTNQETMPTDNAHYEALEAIITNLNRCELEAVAREFADQLLPLIKDAYPQYDGPTRLQDEVPVTYCHTIH
jgi:hypothetical protein